jgi:hypothetical protein
LLVDRAPVRFTLEAPGKVPGRDGAVLQVRADLGADVDLVAAIAREAAGKMANPDV